VSDLLISFAFFVGLAGAAVFTLYAHPILASSHRDDATRDVVRLCAGIFVVMTSLVLGLIVNSAKTTFESADKNVHAYATQLILLDRALKEYGPETANARKSLLAYVKQAAARMAQNDALLSSQAAEGLLSGVAKELALLTPADASQSSLRLRAEQRLETVFEMRWALVEQSEGSIPRPLIMLIGAWLMLIFASFGYCAPRNVVVVTSLIVASFLIASAIYLTLDMEAPFDGPMQVSSKPLIRAIAELEHF
jgi:hypothetical protein